MVAQSSACGCQVGLVSAVAGLESAELIQFGQGGLVAMATQQHGGVVEASGTIVRLHRQYGAEQQFRIIERVTLDANARQQSHGLNMVAVLQEIGADQLFCRLQFMVGK